MRTIELLAPAKNLQIGIEAIKHGADAVYIGGPKFGARASAGNSISDIKKLCDFAHFYGAKVYVTINTIVYDEEISEVQQLINQLYTINVDALIVQDLALCRLQLPPIELHASTQLDITSVEKAQLLEHAGFKQIVLARELSLPQIKSIKEATNVSLEAFVHGALCVSYSGRCYASEYCFKRSANRGQCAQFCRLPFTLKDANGRIIRKDKHLLSLRDMNRSKYLENMIDAGITSFKIEGRLKDLSYVKNVTAFYRKEIDKIIHKRKGELRRSSYGQTSLNFIPQLDKSFNRQFTSYFIDGKRSQEASIDTPKSTGEYIGNITQILGNKLEVIVESEKKLQAGDGLCFIDYEGKLHGFRANTVNHTAQKNKFQVSIFGKPSFKFIGKHQLKLYRNLDLQFDKELNKESASRKLLLKLELTEKDNGFLLSGNDEMGRQAFEELVFEHQISKTPQRENILRQLLKVGDSPYNIEDIEIKLTQDWFIPSSLLANARRNLFDKLLETELQQSIPQSLPYDKHIPIVADKHLDYTANIANHLAKEFYQEVGVESQEPAFEIFQPSGRKTIMFCKYCIRYELGLCKKESERKGSDYLEPFILESSDGKQFELSFNCKKCEMTVLTT